MKIIPLASSSAGNACLVEHGDRLLLLDCGLSAKVLGQRVRDTGHRLTDLDGCMLTHEHKDHARGIRELVEHYQVPIYTSQGTADALGLEKHHRVYVVDAGDIGSLPGWSVQPFAVKHDAVDPIGFFIRPHGSNERLLYVTDAAYIEPRFTGLTHLLIGCNYSESLLQNGFKESDRPEWLRKRIRLSHMSLEQVLEFLDANDLSDLREVWLLHLSDSNSDESAFKAAVQKKTGVPVRVAGQ